MIKNTASQRVGAQMVSAADGSAFTGSVTVSVTVDAGTQATGSVGSGACTHEGNGYHTYAPAQAETNGDLVAFTFTGTGAIPTTVQVYTVAGDAFTRLGAPAGASVSADVAAIKAETATILSDTNDIQTRLPAALVGGRIDANVGAISGDATAADNLEAAADGTGYNLGGGSVVAASVSGAVGSVTGSVGSVAGSVASIASGGITAASFAADAITAAKIAADVTTELQSGLATAASITALDGKIGTVSNLGSGATLAANLADIEAQTDDIGAAGAGLTAADDAILSAIAALNNLSAAQVNAEVDTALADIHLDHLLATTYDPASKPGAADALLNELVESDAGVSRFTANALEQGPSGSGLDAAGVRAAVGLASANLDTQLSTIDTVVDGILADTGTDGVVVAAGSKTGYAIGTGGITALSFDTGAIDAAALAAGAGTEIANAVLTAAAASPVEANVKQVNDVTLTGDGSVTPWGPV